LIVSLEIAKHKMEMRCFRIQQRDENIVRLGENSRDMAPQK